MSKKLTPWFPENVKPVRPGVYRTKFNHDYAGFSYWTGRGWGPTLDDEEAADYHGRMSGECFTQEKRWRGLANPPKEES